MTNTAKTFIIYIYIYYNIFPSSKACSLHVLYGILCIIDDCQRSSSDDSFDPMRRRILSSQILQNDVHQYVFFKACSLLYNFVAKSTTRELLRMIYYSFSKCDRISPQRMQTGIYNNFWCEKFEVVRKFKYGVKCLRVLFNDYFLRMKELSDLIKKIVTRLRKRRPIPSLKKSHYYFKRKLSTYGTSKVHHNISQIM